MNRYHALILVGLVGLSLAVLANAQSETNASGFTELHRVELADATDLEVVMGVIRKDGESVGEKHYHPGGEFGFILEGAVTLRTENEPAHTVKAGASFYTPPGVWHAISTTAEGARTVVFRVLEKGQPMIVKVD